MQRQKIVAGNWKMNGNLEANWELLDKIADHRDNQEASFPEDINPADLMPSCIIFPPSIYLHQAKEIIEESLIQIGAQNVSQYDNGAYTGEISTTMLKDLECSHVLVGHSERRTLFGETNEITAQKFLAAKTAGLIPVFCVGETLAERESGRAESVLAEQLAVITDWENSIIAYEPVWAIGTGVTATPEQAQAMHVWIRECIAKTNPQIAEKISILYGGSVKASNAKTLFSMPDIDGALVGGASLIAEEFIAILDAVSNPQNNIDLFN